MHSAGIIGYRAMAALAAVGLCAALAGRANADPPNYDALRWWGSTATGGQTFTQGSPLTLTWGFMALGTPINDNAHINFPNAN
ncbi:MAG TPA: hypothetical protein VNC50_23065, partial [Planctomycetia bacterium]|nr:hypothetical protein [Planctomycetia bacterium]